MLKKIKCNLCTLHSFSLVSTLVLSLFLIRFAIWHNNKKNLHTLHNKNETTHTQSNMVYASNLTNTANNKTKQQQKKRNKKLNK